MLSCRATMTRTASTIMLSLEARFNHRERKTEVEESATGPQTVLQSYSNQDSMVLAQKQKYRSMEQDRKLRDKPMHIWSPYL